MNGLEMRRERCTRMKAEAKKSFSRHGIREQISPRHWVLQSRYPDTDKWNSAYACNIIVTTGGQLAVVGDIGPMVFAYGSGSPESVVSWMGEHSDLGYYVAQKAHIGMGGAQEMYDVDIAEQELDDLLDEYMGYSGEGDDSDGYRALKEVVEDAKQFYVGDGQQRLLAYLYENLHGNLHSFVFDDGCNIGMVESTSLIYCHAAVARLHSLLEKSR